MLISSFQEANVMIKFEPEKYMLQDGLRLASPEPAPIVGMFLQFLDKHLPMFPEEIHYFLFRKMFHGLPN